MQTRMWAVLGPTEKGPSGEAEPSPRWSPSLVYRSLLLHTEEMKSREVKFGDPVSSRGSGLGSPYRQTLCASFMDTAHVLASILVAVSKPHGSVPPSVLLLSPVPSPIQLHGRCDTVLRVSLPSSQPFVTPDPCLPLFCPGN